MLKLMELRKAKGLSQKQLATILGCSQNMISQWENGTRDPGTETLILISTYFGVTVDYLLGREQTKAGQKEKAIDEAMALYEKLSAEDKEKVKSYIQFVAQVKEGE